MQATPTIRLVDLPPELFERIFLLLRARDICVFAATCRLLRDAYNASPQIQMQLELEVSGMALGPLGTSSARDCLEQLRSKQHAWEMLKTGERVQAPLESGSIWDLFGGVYGQGNIRARSMTVRTGRKGQAKFHFTRLPTPGRTGCDHWSFEDIRVPHGVRDFSFDPALDLMLLIEAKSWPLSVHIRHLSTNEPHSQAVHPIFEYSRQTNVMGPPPTHESFYIQIMGEHFAVLRLPSHQIFGLIPAENEIVVGNWRTGHVITTLMLPELVMQTFCFISPCHFVIGVGDKDQHSNAGLSARPRLQVYKFDPVARPGDAPPPPTLTCELHLPALAQGYFCDQLLTRSDPAPGINMAKAHGRAFAQGPDDRLLVVTVPIRKIDRQQLIMSDVLQVFVRMSSLLEFSALYEHDLDDNGPPPSTFSVFWEGWNTHARALSVTFWEWERTWVCYVYGLRFIYALHLDGDDPRDDPEDRRICLMDFNQLNVRRVASRRGLQASVTKTVVPTEEKTDEELVEELVGLEVSDDISVDEPAESELDLMVEDEDDDDRARGWFDIDEDEGQSSGPPGETQVLIHLEESVHEKECYIDPVRSSLPYMVSISRETFKCKAMMLDEDNIVLVNDGHHDERRRDLAFIPML